MGNVDVCWGKNLSCCKRNTVAQRTLEFISFSFTSLTVSSQAAGCSAPQSPSCHLVALPSSGVLSLYGFLMMGSLGPVGKENRS